MQRALGCKEAVTPSAYACSLVSWKVNNYAPYKGSTLVKLTSLTNGKAALQETIDVLMVARGYVSHLQETVLQSINDAGNDSDEEEVDVCDDLKRRLFPLPSKHQSAKRLKGGSSLAVILPHRNFSTAFLKTSPIMLLPLVTFPDS